MNIERSLLLPFGCPPDWAELNDEELEKVLEEQIKIKEWRRRVNSVPSYPSESAKLDE